MYLMFFASFQVLTLLMTEMMESQVVLLPQGMDGCKLQTFAVDLLGRSGNPEAPPGLRSFSGSAALYEGGT